MASKPVSNLLLKDVAYSEIKKGILEDIYKPGYILSEKELVEDLNMSKTPIKSAIDRLEAEGFVNVSSKRGIIIQDISIERINNIYDLRIVLESYNCEQIYQHIKQEQLDILEENLIQTEKVIQVLDVSQYGELDHAFHRIISRLAGNKEITTILLNYYDHLYRITLKHLKKDPKRMLKFHEDHLLLFEQLKNHDSKCVQSMRNHLEDSKRLLFE